ncbi:MAG: DHH family phosphoesterase [Planctomycetaceae bacterium]
MNIDWTPLRDLLETKQSFVLTTHVRPDADAIGSEIALAGLLTHLGKEVRVINASAVPARLKFLDPHGHCRQVGTQVSENDALQTDVHVIVDTSAWGQLGEMAGVFKKTAAVKVVIDHHAAAEDLGAINLKDVDAEATGALIFQFANALGLPISASGAAALFCAIATDTGWFRFPSSTSGTLRTAAELIDLGAQPSLLYCQLYEQHTLSRIKLAGRVLGRMMVDAGGRLAWTFVTLVDYRETGAEPADTEDLVNECLTVAGIEAAFILIEQPNGNVKASLRSRSHLDVSRVAEEFGGGGHKQAAGAIIRGPLAAVQTRVLAAMKSVVEESPLAPA